MGAPRTSTTPPYRARLVLTVGEGKAASTTTSNVSWSGEPSPLPTDTASLLAPNNHSGLPPSRRTVGGSGAERQFTQGSLCHWSVSRATSAAPNARTEVRHRHPNMSPRIMTPHTATIPADGERRTGDLASNQYEVQEERGRPEHRFSASPPLPLPTRVNALVDGAGVVPNGSPLPRVPCPAGREAPDPVSSGELALIRKQPTDRPGYLCYRDVWRRHHPMVGRVPCSSMSAISAAAPTGSITSGRVPRSASAASSRRVRGGRAATHPNRARLFPPAGISTNFTSFEPQRGNPAGSTWKAPATRNGQGRGAKEAEPGSAGGVETRRRPGASLDSRRSGATLRRAGGRNPDTPGQGVVKGYSSGLGPGFGSTTPRHGRCNPVRGSGADRLFRTELASHPDQSDHRMGLSVAEGPDPS